MTAREPLQIVGIERKNGDGLIVEYSDQSTAIYTIEQIAALEPKMRIFETEPEEEI